MIRCRIGIHTKYKPFFKNMKAIITVVTSFAEVARLSRDLVTSSAHFNEVDGEPPLKSQYPNLSVMIPGKGQVEQKFEGPGDTFSLGDYCFTEYREENSHLWSHEFETRTGKALLTAQRGENGVWTLFGVGLPAIEIIANGVQFVKLDIELDPGYHSKVSANVLGLLLGTGQISRNRFWGLAEPAA